MRVTKQDLLNVTARMQMDLRAAQAQLVALRASVAALDIPDPTLVTCPECGLAHNSGNALAEHRYHLHGGPEPEHWLAAAALALPVEKDPTERSVGEFVSDT